MASGFLGRESCNPLFLEAHRLLGNADYAAETAGSLEEAIRRSDRSAWNLSEEFAREALSLCDELSPEAQLSRCVTALLRREDGTLYGDNPGCFGFAIMLQLGHINVRKTRCLVLGSGTDADTAAAALKLLGAGEILRCSEKELADSDAIYSIGADAKLIVNATGIGSAPDCERTPINLLRFQRVTAVADFITDPFKSCLILSAERMQIATAAGLSFLVASAAKSEELFSGKSFAEGKIDEVLHALEVRQKNILLVGMKGSGCEELGKILAERTGRELLIFEEQGSAKRNSHSASSSDSMSQEERAETEKLRKLSVLGGKVMVFPGRMMANRENRLLLRRNSIVIWIQNPGCGEGAYEEYIYREPLYIESCDYTFVHHGNTESVAQRILECTGTAPDQAENAIK